MFSSTAGLVVSISAGVPSTFDSTGYEALTFTPIKEIQNVGGYGAAWANGLNKPVDLRGTQAHKTSRDPGGFNLSMKLDTDDAGQVLCKAARDSATALYSFKFLTSNGDAYYCQAIVNDFQVEPGTQDDDMMATLIAKVTTSATDVDWVEVLAA